ncbi:MAG: WG repeat-containing protein, partial [Muribaculaceae bacterium]|nr:WG repeat-containing protein [Muribaculaceae bacterium]
MADYNEGNKITVRKLISDEDEKYERFEEHWKYGFKKDGVIVIPAEYDDAWYFSEGVAAVERDCMWGYIDTAGNEVIPCKYNAAEAFSEGLAEALRNDKWGYIDRIGKEVIPFIFDCTSEFENGKADVNLDGKPGTIDKL